MPPATVWYDRTATDDRVWCVRQDGVTVRARSVVFQGEAITGFDPAGFMDLQPGGPRGIIRCDSVLLFDEIPT